MAVFDGGEVAARGFHMQYLVTVDRLLDLVADDDDSSATLHIEQSGRSSATASDDQAIDLAYACAGHRILAQVKSVKDPGTAPPIGRNEALRAFGRMVSTGGATSYELITNRRIAGSGRRLQRMLSAHEDIPTEGPDDPLLDMDRAALSRCTVVEIGMSQHEFMADLVTRIVDWRRRHRIGTGPESAYLMLGFLIHEIFSRAAGLSPRMITRHDALGMLRTPASAVASALGDVDWGNSIGSWPPPPVIRRDGEITAVSAAFDGVGDERKTRRMVVRGPSGIGKSSIAAGYAYEYADRYDLMVWINSGDADSRLASFNNLLWALGKDSGAVPTPETVRSAVERYPGHLLLVVDNADRESTPWLPAVGTCDVILTCLDPGMWRGWPEVRVSALNPEQSVELLSELMPTYSGDLDVMSRLAEELDHWPLALAMAASYLEGTGAPTGSMTEEFIRKIVPVAIADESGVPEGYPRSLASAIMTAVGGLHGIGDPHDEVGNLAASLIFASALLAKDDIPLTLLTSVACIDPLDVRGQGLEGPVEPLDLEVAVEQALRLLRARSLIRRHRRPRKSPDALDTDVVSVNSITQIVLRNHVRQLGQENFADAIERAAFHVTGWLRLFVDSEDYSAILEIAPHATAALLHAREMGLVTAASVTLAGNLAQAHRIQGDFDAASECLRYELRQLRALDHADAGVETNFLRAKTLSQLLYVEIQRELPVDELVQVLTTCLDAIERVSDRLDIESRAALLINLGNGLEEIYPSMKPREAWQIAHRIDLMMRDDDTDPQLVRACLRISRLVGEPGGESEAIGLIGAALETEPPLYRRLELLGLNGEAHAWLRRYTRASELIDEVDALAPVDALDDEVVTRLNNAALAAVAHLDVSKGAVLLMQKCLLLAAPRLPRTGPSEQRRHHVLRGAFALSTHDRESAVAVLAQLERLGVGTSYGVRSESLREPVIRGLRRLLSGSEW